MKHQKTSNPCRRFNCLNPRAILTVLATCAFFGLATLAGAQQYTISGNWFVTNNVVSSTNHITAGDVNRGLAYSAISNQVYVCNKGTPAIDVLDAATGNYLGSAVTTGVAGGTFLLDQVAVADDGIIYGANLSTGVGSSPFKIYQWTNWNTAPYLSFSGDPSGGTLTSLRMGDNLVVQGSGTGTVLLAPMTSSTRATTNVVLFSTTDGMNFTPTVLNITNLPVPSSGNNGPAIAVSFYTNNTFLFKQNGAALYLVQYPANFASLASPVNAAAIATNAFFAASGNVGQTVLNYSPAGSLLAAVGPIPNSAPSTTLVNLYSGNPMSGINISVGSANSPHANANGNFAGGVALGGNGKTNFLFTLDCNNGVRGWGLAFVAAPVAPTIGSQPVGNNVYTNYGPYAFTISAAGSVPLTYYWQYNSVSNQATATTFLVTSNSFYTISNLTTAASGWYDCIVSNVAGTTNSDVVQLTVSTPLASAYVTSLWSLAADNSQPYLDTGYNTRGLAFDPNTMSVLVAEHNAAQIYALNATNGQLKFEITGPTTGLPAGSIFPLGQVGVADDGIAYCCNVSSYQPGQQTGLNDFTIVRFDSIADYNGPNPPNVSLAFVGDPGAYSPVDHPGTSSQDRWGDSMAVRGAGPGTQILLGSYETQGANLYGTGSGTNVAILTTTDGLNFTATTITVTNAPDGFAYLGVAWGVGNTFWAKSPGYDLREVEYDLNSGYGNVILSFATTASAGSLSSVCGIGLDVSNNILAGVNVGDVPNDLELFQIPTLGFPPESYYQAFFPAYNANINGNAATTIKYPYIFSLDANNGIIGLKYSIPLLPFGIVSSYANSRQILTWQTIIGHTYQLEATNALAGGTNDWPHVGPAISAPSLGTLSYTNSSFGGPALFYRVIAQ